MSPKESLNQEDIIRWAKNTVVFSIPALTAFLVAVQGGVDYRVAFGMAVQALIASAIDLLKKYSAGTPTNVSATTTTTKITVAEPVVKEVEVTPPSSV